MLPSPISVVVFGFVCLSFCLSLCKAFTVQTTQRHTRRTEIYSSNYDSGSSDANKWQSSEILPYEEQEDWEESVTARQDGSLWSSFTSSEEETGDETNDDKKSKSSIVDEMDDGEEAWLDALAKISADEVEFMNVEADRADKVRQMQEMEFSSESIEATLGVAVDESLEIDETNVVFEQFKEETRKTGFGMYLDDEYDMETVESHATVERDEDTGDPVRTQMVYVDEVTCIGCTNCAMVSNRWIRISIYTKSLTTMIL